jgi:hypothetical protein
MRCVWRVLRAEIKRSAAAALRPAVCITAERVAPAGVCAQREPTPTQCIYPAQSNESKNNRRPNNSSNHCARPVLPN